MKEIIRELRGETDKANHMLFLFLTPDGHSAGD